MRANEQPANNPQSPIAHQWGLLLALQFLTVLPIPSPNKQQPEDTTASVFDMSVALPWFPVVGALIGALLVAVDWVLTPIFALPVRNVALLAVSALVTGMLHLDGFVDCCDAVLGTRTVEQRMAILRDSRVGAYGALGGALLLLAFFAALGELHGTTRILALLLAPTLGRWAMVWLIVCFPYARQQGVGSAFRATTRHLIAATGALVALLLVIALAFTLSAHLTIAVFTAALLLLGLVFILLVLLSLLVAFAWAAWASRRLGGGLTGDTYGAANELVELLVLLLLPVLVQLIFRLPIRL